MTIGAYRKVHENFSLGFGGGIVEDWKFSIPQIPLFVGLHSEFPLETLTPTFDVQVGYQMNFGNMGNGSIFLNPVAGVRFGSFGIGVGYLGGKILKDGYKWGSSMNVRFSYFFNYHKTTGSERLRNNLNFSTALGYDFIASFGKKSEGSNAGNPTARPSMGIELALLYSLNDNIAVGLSGSAHVLQYELETYGYETPAWGAIAARGKYNFKQVSESIYPWVQLDLGASMGQEEIGTSFYYSPAIGVSKSVRDGRSSIDLGISYNTLKNKDSVYNSEDITMGIVKISLGYTF